MTNPNVPMVFGPQQVDPDRWMMVRTLSQAMSTEQDFQTSMGAAILKYTFCAENRLPYSMAPQLAFIKGKMVIPGAIIASLLRSHPLYDYHIDRLDNLGCTISILRRKSLSEPWGVEGRATFDMQDAQQAGLAEKDIWQKYRQDMLFNRALARAQRRYAPDLFAGSVYTPGELSDGTVEAEFQELFPMEPGDPQPVPDLTREEIEAIRAVEPGNVQEIAAALGEERYIEFALAHGLVTWDDWQLLLQHMDLEEELEHLTTEQGEADEARSPKL
jgi:hypothetical protein